MSQLPVNKDTSSLGSNVTAPKTVKSIYLEDFRSYDRAKIELGGPGQLTVLAGPTDAGKSVWFRALRLLLYNSFIGKPENSIRYERDTLTAALEMADGTRVVRERSRGSVNRYRIVKPGATNGGQKLEGFGNEVPQEVIDVTGVRPVAINERQFRLNLAGQLEPSFLGLESTTAPERAKVMGYLAGTEEVDAAHVALGTDIANSRSERDRLEAGLESLDKRIAQYSWLESLKESIDAAEVVVARLKANEERRDKLAGIRQRLNDVAARELEARKTLEKWANLDRLELVVVTRIEPTANKAQCLREAKTELEKVGGSLALWQQIADKWAGVEDAATIYARIERDARRIANLREARRGLSLTSEAIRKAEAINEKWQGVEPAAAIVADLGSSISRAANLRRAKKALVDNASAQTAQQVTLDRWADVEKAAELMARVAESREQAARLRQLRAGLCENAGRQNDQDSVIARYAGVEQAAEIAVRIEVSIQKSMTLRDIRSRLTANHEAQIVAEDALKRQSQALADAEKAYTDKLAVLGRCPLCGSTVDPQLVKEVAS